jgi:isopentenyl-diphosphate Delta-isomerase
MSEEIFDVVDEADQVVGQAPRPVVHAQNLLHRAVSIFVLRIDGRLLLQLRSDSKDQYPGCYTSSASGHVDSGEDYESAAVRELREELSLELPIEYLAKFPGGPETAFEFTRLYQLVTDVEPTLDPEEIVSAEFLPLDEIASMIEQSPEQFTPPFRVLFDWFYDDRQNSGAAEVGGD